MIGIQLLKLLQDRITALQTINKNLNAHNHASNISQNYVRIQECKEIVKMVYKFQAQEN